LPIRYYEFTTVRLTINPSISLIQNYNDMPQLKLIIVDPQLINNDAEVHSLAAQSIECKLL